MVIGLDGVELDTQETTVDLGVHADLEGKYVLAVDSKVDIVMTSSKVVADYFKENGVATFIKD